MAVVLGHYAKEGLFEKLKVPGIPDFNPMKLLHGEEALFFEKPLEAGKKYILQDELKDVQDKGTGCLLIADTEIREADTNDLCVTIRTGTFLRGTEKFGWKGTIKAEYPKTPKRDPDMVAVEETTKNLAFLYRLCNDTNPLHVDPKQSAIGGFKAPILHGLCFYGFTARSLQQHFFKEDPNQMKSYQARFTGHVFPGETLIVEAWKDGNVIIFQTKVKERNTICLKGFLELKPTAKL